jgi:hypothetical protein
VFPEVVYELHRVHVVGYAEVGADFLPLDVARADAEDDIRPVLQALQEPHLGVGVETGENTRSVIVEHEFAAEFKVELVAALP